MGVFNGNSIYKAGGGGGGGGGYADGGNLTPADYIELENNSFYKLEGNDAADLNFLIDGESGVLNSIVEVSTNVNSIVSVYVDKNGLLYKLSCLAPNIEAGKSYRILIQGDNFTIEEIQNIDLELSKAEFDGHYINVFKVGTYVISEDLGSWFNRSEIDRLVLSTGGKWRKPNVEFAEYLKAAFPAGPSLDSIRSTSGWTTTNGTNTTGLDFYPYGRIEYGSTLGDGTVNLTWADPKNDGFNNSNYFMLSNSNISWSTILEDDEIYLRARVMLA